MDSEFLRKDRLIRFDTMIKTLPLQHSIFERFLPPFMSSLTSDGSTLNCLKDGFHSDSRKLFFWEKHLTFGICTSRLFSCQVGYLIQNEQKKSGIAQRTKDRDSARTELSGSSWLQWCWHTTEMTSLDISSESLPKTHVLKPSILNNKLCFIDTNMHAAHFNAKYSSGSVVLFPLGKPSSKVSYHSHLALHCCW